MKKTLWITLSALLSLGALGLTGCHEEPPIVVKFQPNDLAGQAAQPTAHADAAPPATVKDASPAQAPGDAATAEAAEAHKPRGKAECHVAADCTVAAVDCCDCANGGKQQAVPKHELKHLEAARKKRCKGAMCTMMLSVDPTCGKRADCVEGRCVLVEKSGGAKPGSLEEKLKTRPMPKK